MQKVVTKNKDETKARLVSALGDVLAEKGFAKVGVNAVARQAGVDKVLIYRYFNDLNGLMKAYAQSSQFWPSLEELLGKGNAYEELIIQPFSAVIATVFRRYANALRSRPLTLEILSWETVERNALTIELEDVRETLGLELMFRLSSIHPPEADWQAIINIFSSSIHYLAIRGRKISTFTGMEINSDEAWQRLLNTMEFLILNITKEEKGVK